MHILYIYYIYIQCRQLISNLADKIYFIGSGNFRGLDIAFKCDKPYDNVITLTHKYTI